MFHVFYLQHIYARMLDYRTFFSAQNISLFAIVRQNSENTALLANPSVFKRFNPGSSEIIGNYIDFNIKIKVKSISDRV